MSRNRVKSELAIKSWSEADTALRQIAECENLIAEQAINMNRQMADIKAAHEVLCKPIANRVKNLEQQLKEFTDANRTDLVGKSKSMNFGKLGYRLSTTISIKKDQEAGIIALLRSMGLLDCVSIKESVNKDNLKTKPIEVISGVGAVLSSKDEFWYETAKEQLQHPEM